MKFLFIVVMLSAPILSASHGLEESKRCHYEYDKLVGFDQPEGKNIINKLKKACAEFIKINDEIKNAATNVSKRGSKRSNFNRDQLVEARTEHLAKVLAPAEAEYNSYVENYGPPEYVPGDYGNGG